MKPLFIFLLLVIISFGHEGEHDDSMPKPEAVLIEEYPFYGYNFSYSTSDSENWLNSGTLAHYLNIHAIKSLSIPVTVNIILLGFEGDGSEGINLKPEDLKPWFEHLDHYVNHVIVPVGEEQTTTNIFHTENIATEYSLHLNVLKLCPLVSTILEDTIYWNLRPEEVEVGEQSHVHANQDRINYYVNSERFEGILLDLVNYLKISDTYTLFILNPHHPFDTPKERYGYRSGFSDSELNLLYSDKSFDSLKKKSDEAVKNYKQSTPGVMISSYYKTKKYQEQTLNDKIQYKDFIEESEKWAQKYLEQQKSKEESVFKYIETPVYDIANYWLEKGSFNQQLYINDIIQNPSASHENCLVDTWISSNRFAWIDLSAGPFEWGPVIAGEGVRSIHSLPTIPPRVKLLQEKNQSISETGHTHSSDDRYKEYIFELTLLQSYYDQLCSQDQRYQSEKLCNDLQNRISKLKNPSDNSIESTPIISGGDDEGLHSSMLVDDVLSRLSSVVSSSIRHIFLPASPLYRTPYAERIIFHFFQISNGNENDQEQDSFSYTEYVRELRKLKLPSQDFVFAKKRIFMSEDTELLNAFTKSLRTTNIPKLSIDGQFSTFSQIYLDSKEIQHYLKILSTDSWDHKEQDPQEFLMSRHIPIFLFSLGQDSTPLLIDKYYQAKAMSDMVLIVQSNVNSWESRLACDKKPIYWNLNNPLKSALSATSLLLSGLIPTHISYSDATHRAYQNWMWSVGDSPLSYTSAQYTFSEIHKDIAFRNYIVTSLSDSLQIVNEGAAILANLKTNPENERAVPLLPLKNISTAYAEVRANWVELIRATSHTSYSGVTAKLKSLSEATKEFRELVTQAAETLDLLKCIPVKKDNFLSANLDWLLPVCVVVDVIFLFVFLLFRRRKHKIKIN